MKKENVREQLQFPRKETKGRTRWWWYGCAVDRDELVRELDEIEKAGMGGVELQILYPLEADDEEKGVKNYDYMSPEYLDLIRFAAEETEKRGMQFDLTLGSSWPFGGPFVSEELAGQNVLPFSIDVQGPCKFYQDLTTVVYGKVVGAVIGKMENAEMLPETIVDITDKVIDKYLFNWPWGTEISEIDVPEGTHKIVLFVSSDKKQTVLKPLRGGDGLIIDHNRKESLRSFLEYAGDPIAEAVGEGKIKNYFCDSIEVFGHNWTDILYDEFKKRRGYDLRPYLYALWGEVRGMTEQVRYDYQKTMAELTVENFFEELTAWSHEKGAKSRIQAHGTWGDVLKAYGAADIPEGETFSAFDRYEVNTIHRKLAVSAAHVYHKPIASNESFTWLRFPRFVVTLENIKAAADSIFLDGINQIINHGYSYSKSEKEDMLAFYASTNINHTNTWWKYYGKIGKYINRVCDFMQRGEMKISTAVYLPQHDIWAETPIADTHMCMKLDERLESSCINGIHKAGYWFDYVNDDVLEHWEDYGYDTLILIECDRIPLATMEKIQKFAENGGKVLAAGRLPKKACGLIGYYDACRNVVRIGEELKANGQVRVTEDKFESLVQALSEIKEPDVKIMNHADVIGYVHRTTETEDIYFVSNISPEDHREVIRFHGEVRNFSVFDPMTGEEKEILGCTKDGEDTIVTLDIDAFQSLLFVYADDMEEPTITEEKCAEEIVLDLSEGWKLEVTEKSFEKEYDRLQSWEKEPELKYYSGKGRYSLKFEISEAAWTKLTEVKRAVLKLEHVGETAEIYVNGTLAETLIKRPYRADILKHLHQGTNEIEICTANLLINRMIDPEYPEPVLDKNISQWPYATGRLEGCRQERLYNWREREMIKEPVASGLWGNIYISI